MSHTRDVITVNLSNQAHSVTRRQQRAALRTLIKRHHRPAVIATQEAVAGLKAPRGYLKFAGPGGLSQLPIFVKAALNVTGHGYERSFKGQEGKWPDRGLVWVRLGDGLVVINVHANSRIDAGGKPRPGEAWNLTRSHHFPDIDAAVLHHQRTDRPVVVGDWNIDRRADRAGKVVTFPARRMLRVGMVEAAYKGGTHGHRAIDRAFYDPSRLDLVFAHRIAKAHGRFDHRPVKLRVRCR